MALTILKLTPIHCVAKVTGAGATTITLATDLLVSGRQTASTPTVNIGCIHFAIPGSTEATIARNSVVGWRLVGNYAFDFNGFTDNANNTSDIVVTLPSGGGTVILELVKTGGYGDVQQSNAIVGVG